MVIENRVPDRHFSSFYEDNSLLIQFILEEFAQSYRLILQIQTLIQTYLNSRRRLDSLFSSLIQILDQLVGSFPQQERSLHSRWTKGPLTKLKEYCEQFSRNSAYQNKHHVNLHMAAHQAWLTAVHNLELLSSLYINPYIPESLRILIPFQRTFHSLQMRLNQMSCSIPKIISAYWDNENVILYLLRKKDLIAEIYGSDFLYKRFKWPLKIPELIQFLIHRYQSRGFEALLPIIEHLLACEEKQSNPLSRK